MRIGVLLARVRVEEKLLLEELERRGVEVERVDVADVKLALEHGRVQEPWASYDAVLERCVSHSRAQAVLRVLESWGVPCVNPSRVAEVCGDKLATTVALAAKGVPVPRCRVAVTPEAAVEALEELGYPAVIKPAVGSWGRLLARVSDREAAEAVLEHKATLGTYHHSIFYLQEFVPHGGRDVRTFVVGNDVICAIERRTDHWITNTARGASVAAVEVTDELRRISLAAARAVGGGAVAIDLFETPQAGSGGWLVNEVNYTMEFRNSIEPTGVNIPARIVDHVIETAERGTLLPADMPGPDPLPHAVEGGLERAWGAETMRGMGRGVGRGDDA